MSFVANVLVIHEPTFYYLAKRDEKWVKATNKELIAVEANGTWILACLPVRKKATNSKWAYRVKCNPNGTIEREETKAKKQVDFLEVHQKALDDLVNVNSLFTIAVFVGLSFASPGQHSLENRPECDADPGVAKRLILYEVISFAFFLLSSLVAKTLKVFLNIYPDEAMVGIHKLLKGIMLYLSAIGSIIGIVFLSLSMANVIQIRVGKLSCGSRYALSAVGSLCGIVLLALFIYVPLMLFAIWRSLARKPEPRPRV
ncbi:uncharacterized protein LOC110642274 [Hevea brasiliensis]|uniref:uncharacterized protein LOC110642274 n=1 Tax=Hevea brasiliensis TaxID=3981 RepID=UPI0025E3114F|nr:uncharacterized protein LOC110642274 [Hevea brasiliensis]